MVDPRLRVPRHMRLFEKMMVQLFFKMKVRSSTGYLTLMREIKNPITDHVPANIQFIRVEKDGEMVSPFTIAEQLGHEAQRAPRAGPAAAGDQLVQMKRDKAVGQFQPFAFVVGGMSKGDVEADYAPKDKVRNIKLADRGMSAAAVLSMLLHGFEEAWLKEDNEEV
ncbi:essential for mitotic growth 1 [Strigomonas culicis]|uniref:Essential for mitotic growth 1 n=1 Tax=Strigomonas culicis TaxID=28005 RepID=S9W601_9TRYP|nr:essential for mitotic growth 1 [Strigomonas culicis]|eukprot:EPY34626.1 essential for mitotic growth 1 [Strigomonas culicis]